MEGELQQLIDRIKKDAVDAGRQEAEAVLIEARAQAAGLVREAETKSQAIIEKAGQDAQQFTERGKQTLQQAARDLLITVGRGIETILSDLAIEDAGQALKPDTMAKMLVKICDGFAASGGRETRLEVLLSPADQKELVAHFRQLFQKDVVSGMTLHSQDGIFKGFKIRAEGRKVVHDFTHEAIAEALSNFLRPHLAEIVTRAARGGIHAAE